MYCTQCGCKIEDVFKFCPECGAEAVEIRSVDMRSDLDRLVDEIYLKNKGNRVYSTKELMQKAGLDFRQAKELIERKHVSPEVIEENRKTKEHHKEETRQAWREVGDAFERANDAFASSKPKKGVVYESKKLSVGRGLVGYGLAGPAGAVLGGLSSKKRQAIDPETGKKLSKREARKRMK